MKIKIMVLGPIQTNCHIVWGESGRALVIDPGAEPEKILDFLERKQLLVAAYALTHGHMDHIGALADVATVRPAPVAMHPADRLWAFTPANQMPPIFGIPRRPAGEERPIEDGQEWNDTDAKYRIMATPGHSPGGVCFYFPEKRVLFSGDTLFRRSAGRTDLPGGDDEALAGSLRKLCDLPGDTMVYPGHGERTTIADELRSNPFLAGL